MSKEWKSDGKGCVSLLPVGMPGYVGRVTVSPDGDMRAELWNYQTKSWDINRLSLVDILQCGPAKESLLIECGIPPEDWK